jgi:hypothetical protein
MVCKVAVTKPITFNDLSRKENNFLKQSLFLASLIDGSSEIQNPIELETFSESYENEFEFFRSLIIKNEFNTNY